MKLALALAAIVLTLIAVALLLPFVVDLNRYQDHYRPLIERALNRTIRIEDIRLMLWPKLGARVSGLTVLDDPAFSRDPFASLTALEVGVKLTPLLSGRIEVEEITLRDPVVTVVKAKTGALNVSTIGPQEPTSPMQTPGQAGASPLHALALFAVDKVQVTGGTLTFRDLSAAEPTEYSVHSLDVQLKDVHLGETPIVHAAATVQPLALPVQLDGTFGPLTQEVELERFEFRLALGEAILSVEGSLVGSLLHAAVSAPLIDMATLPVPPVSGKPVRITDFRATVEAPYPPKQGIPPLELMDVRHLDCTVQLGQSTLRATGTLSRGRGTLAVASASISTADVPASVPLTRPVTVTDVSMNATLQGHEVEIPNLSFRIFGGTVKMNGGLVLDSTSPPFTGAMRLQGVQLGPALQTIGTGGIAVSGTAAADLVMMGRGWSMPELTRSIQASGHVGIKDAKVEGVNFLREALGLLNAMGARADIARATAFSTIETDVVVDHGIATLQRFSMSSHDFQVIGSGTAGLIDQRLNLKADLRLSPALSQQVVAQAPAARLATTGGRLSLPLLIGGTVQAPSYGLDTKVFGAKVQEQVQQRVEQAIGDFLQGKTHPQDLERQGKDLLKQFLGR